MRILIASGVPRQSEAGAAAVALNHALELARKGHAVDCWFLDDVLAKPARPKRFEALIFALALAKRIARGRTKYDVVNLHAPSGCAYGIFRWARRGRGLPPYVFTMQGSEEWYAKIMREEHEKGRAWNFGWKNRFWHWLYHQKMYDFSIRTAGFGAIANSDACRGAEAKFKMPPGRLWFVPNGTEEQFFIRREYSQRASVRLLFVGTWLDRKGVYYLVDAFQILTKKRPGLTLTVAGCLIPEANVLEYFPHEVRHLIHVIPFIKRGGMPNLYAEHDIFVFPSLIEGMPLALLEAMATGMPIVTTNSPGMADVVQNGQNGLLVPTADAMQLAEAVSRFCDSVELRRELGTAAQRTARRYTWESVTKQLGDVLRLAVNPEPAQ